MKNENKRQSSIEKLSNQVKNSVDRLNSIFEMAEKRITYPEDRSYPIQRTEGRNEIEELSLRELWDNGNINLNITVMVIIEREKREKGTGYI